MTEKQWKFFCKFKREFKHFCEKSQDFNSDENLTKIQKLVAHDNNVPDYNLETNVVYNRDLENFTEKSKIKLILVADNPGKNEQLAKNRKYLVGHSGKLGENFFSKNPELKIDFRENILILNKSPLHTAKTALLKKLLKTFEAKTKSEALKFFFIKSQEFMADWAYQLQQAFDCKLLIVGYGELGRGKIFENYWQNLKILYEKINGEGLLCFQHFSMNRFTIDLKQNYNNELSLKDNLEKLGIKHRRKIFGF